MESNLRVSLNTCPLHKILKKKTKRFITNSGKTCTNQHNTPGQMKTCHVPRCETHFAIWFPHSPSFHFLGSLSLTLFFSLILFFSETLNSSQSFAPFPPFFLYSFHHFDNCIIHLGKYFFLKTPLSICKNCAFF